MPAEIPHEKSSGSRLLFIDNIRILLISLVITTHSAIAYGGVGSWYLMDAGTGTVTLFILSVIDVLNQSFFMGFFVLISAYFIPGSVGRKGVGKFVHDRLVRLGIPLVFWVIVMNPLIFFLVAVGTGKAVGTLPEFLIYTYTHLEGGSLFGPMWFVMFLLLATFAFLAWEYVVPPKTPVGKDPAPYPGLRAILCLALLLSVVTFVVRIFQPIGSFSILGFQLPFFPQYIAFFIIGIYAARNKWFDRITHETGKLCAIGALLLAIALPFLLLLVMSSSGGIEFVRGGIHGQALIFAFWEQFEGVLMIAGLLWIFSTRFNEQGPVLRAMAGDSYTVYIIHPVIIILLTIALMSAPLPAILKFVIELPLAICGSFIIAHLIRAVPGIQRIL